MEQYIINGGNPLVGEVVIGGAKNAALGILAAAVMADEFVTIRNLPDVNDVNILLEAIRQTGAIVIREDRHTVRVNGSTVHSHVVDNVFVKKMRASYYMLGAFLGKYHDAVVSLPGGCNIGTRPVNQHMKGFYALGATGGISNGSIAVRAKALNGARVYFDIVSVGATINVMLAAALAKGRTVLENVAKEPHVVDVANMLNSMGANIKGAGTDVIRIEGVEKLHGTDYSVIPDQIEAGTFMIAAAATKGDITVKSVIPKHLDCISSKLREVGCEISEFDDAVRVVCNRRVMATSVNTLPYPGFPTDMQPQISVLLCLANGTSVVNETVFDNRFRYVGELTRMGANVQVEKGNVAIIRGTTSLSGTSVTVPDLRAGAALVIAALAARGMSVLDEISYIKRGYEDFAQKITELGGMIREIDSEREVQRYLAGRMA